MLMFAKKLEEVLGSQVGHAKDLQQQTLLALEKAVSSFQAMASQIGQAGETASSTMSSHLGKAITDMAVQQEQMNAGVRALIGDLKEAVVRTQTTTGAGVEQLLSDLGSQVQRTVGSIQEQMNSNYLCPARPTSITSQTRWRIRLITSPTTLMSRTLPFRKQPRRWWAN